ncbi:DNA/RNA non-specific endonuclease [Spirosoma sp.]|uniref:DNA/RNA non-specific endonuclease n=1 Tax=Spirosoma sp. TaxID=1899569 RepID=UPI003B3AAF51
MKDLKDKLSQVLATIQENDPELASEFQKVRKQEKYQEEARSLTPMVEAFAGDFENIGPGATLETIVLRVGRPVLSVFNDEAVLEFRDAESAVWQNRLTDARPRLTTAIKAVGRIELENHPTFEWVGTGWLVDENIVVTNRHVAELFGRSNNNTGFVFRQGIANRTMSASIDFIEEFNNTLDATFRVESILHIEKESGPDLAFLRVKSIAGKTLADPIPLSTDRVKGKPDIAVIGYPARDSRIPDQQLMTDIFGDVYNKKRLAPGQVTGLTTDALLHDCSTLGGNSGSVVLDLKSGKALGIHFAGRFLESNFAVSASLISERLKKLKKASVNPGSGMNHVTPSDNGADHNLPAVVTLPATLQPSASQQTVSFTIPLQISVTIGNPVYNQDVTPVKISTVSQVTKATDDDDLIADSEATPADYADRIGYVSDFLGADADVPLPKPNDSLKKDILTFGPTGKPQHVLKYQHFSVVMSRSRRMCFFSAVNIDGKASVRSKRVGWRLDPRIPAKAQIMKECYGNEPKFSRGHMTRREDPVWGSPDVANEGNADSMHVTNAVPQMQPFNAGIWLGLEDYALENAREDDMRISVFTGPIFQADDPIKFGVKIPRSFWKIITFIHDQTGELCATGYTMSQEGFLREEEFIFGQHDTAQVPIASIESLTGLSFGQLTDVDPLNSVRESLTASSVLKNFNQIQFL